MEPEAGWRMVIHAYLQAFCESQRRRYEDEVTGWEANFLAVHGSDSVRQAFMRAAMATRDQSGEPGPQETYTTIEQTEDRLLVEVAPHRSSPRVRWPIPFWPTRFVLAKGGRSWVIEAILQPCIACNLPPVSEKSPVIKRTPGKCNLCHGSGSLVNSVCFACGGKAICRDCGGEAMPGWQRMVSIAGGRRDDS